MSTPAMLKKRGDWSYRGINHFVLHFIFINLMIQVPGVNALVQYRIQQIIPGFKKVQSFMTI